MCEMYASGAMYAIMSSSLRPSEQRVPFRSIELRSLVWTWVLVREERIHFRPAWCQLQWMEAVRTETHRYKE